MYKDDGSDARKVYNHDSLKPLLRFHHFNQLNVDFIIINFQIIFILSHFFFTL